MTEASQTIALAREYARAARDRDINHMPPSRLMSELAETRRQLGLVLGAITAKASGPPSQQEYTAAAVEAITQAHAAQQDLAGWLAAVLATVAAGLGSTEALLAGRPGSWEAGHVRDLLAGTVGWDDEYLADHRADAS